MADLLSNFLQEESHRLTGYIDRKVTPSSPWISQIRKKEWKGEVGHIISNVMWERSFPKTAEAWTQFLENTTGTGNICLPKVDQVRFNQTVRHSNLAAKAIESPDFCVDDLRAKWKRDEQLELVTRNLVDTTKFYNIRRNRMAFMGACNRKIIPTTTGFQTTDEASIVTQADREDYGDALFADTDPNSVMTNGMLDYLHVSLDREDAGMHSAAQKGGGYIYKLCTSAEHSQWLRKGDAVVREDFRNSSHSDILLKGVGVSHSYNGYVHVIDPLPRRWKRTADGASASTNDWEELDPYVEVTEGHWEINPLYEEAPYEDGSILITAVIDCLVPRPISNVGGAKFVPQNHSGEYTFVNIKHRTDNPDGTIGFFRGKIVNGFQTRHPELGICFRHQRVPFELDVFDVTA